MKIVEGFWKWKLFGKGDTDSALTQCFLMENSLQFSKEVVPIEGCRLKSIHRKDFLFFLTLAHHKSYVTFQLLVFIVNKIILGILMHRLGEGRAIVRIKRRVDEGGPAAKNG